MHLIVKERVVCVVYVYCDSGICAQTWHVQRKGAVLQNSYTTVSHKFIAFEVVYSSTLFHHFLYYKHINKFQDQKENNDWEILKQQLKEVQKSSPIFIVEKCLTKDFTSHFSIVPKTFEYSFQFFSEAAVIKARNVADDKAVSRWNARNTLGRYIVLNIADEFVYEIPRDIELPFTESFSVTLKGIENFCKVHILKSKTD